MKVTIDRSRWLIPPSCPEQDGELCDRTGYMCCLGFLGEACGVARETLRGRQLPSEIKEAGNWPVRLFEATPSLDQTVRTSLSMTVESWEDALAHVNDSDGVDNATREEWIAYGFRHLLGVEAEFVGEYPAPREMEFCFCGSRLQPGQSEEDCENCDGSGLDPNESEDE